MRPPPHFIEWQWKKYLHPPEEVHRVLGRAERLQLGSVSSTKEQGLSIITNS
jgi:hypothetical protein